MDDSLDFDQLLNAWPIERPFGIRPTRRGVSRLTRFVDTAQASYVVCVYLPGTPEGRVRYEHALLAALSRAGLPFAVPTPVLTKSGETLVQAPGVDSERMVALFSVVPGEDLDRADVEMKRAFGAALGHLHRAFAEIDAGPAPAWDRTYGVMERLLAGDREVIASLEDSPAVEGSHGRCVEILAELCEEGPAIRRALPRDLRHGDYHGGNVLAAGGRISGVLDFEVAGPGVRAMDLAHGWYYQWAWTTAPDEVWEHISAFASGYRNVLSPTAAELKAVPTLTRMYFASSIPYVVSRWRRGEVGEERVQARVEQLFTLDNFLKGNADRVVDVLSGGEP